MIFIALAVFISIFFSFFRGQTQASESKRKLIERPMNNIYLILNSLCVNFVFFFRYSNLSFFPPIIFSLAEKKKLFICSIFFVGFLAQFSK